MGGLTVNYFSSNRRPKRSETIRVIKATWNRKALSAYNCWTSESATIAPDEFRYVIL